MTEIGALLHVLAAGLVIMFWRQVRGLSFDDLLERSHREHHRVLAVIAKHPRGGSWTEHQAWMGEET